MIYGNISLETCDINISAQEIYELSLYCKSLNLNSSYISESAAAKADQNLHKMCSKLNWNYGKINSAMAKCTNSSINAIKKDGLNKSVFAQISTYVDDMNKSIADAIDKAFDIEDLKIDKDLDYNKITKSIGLLAIDIIIPTIVASVLSYFVGFPIANAIEVGIVGPIVEEATKEIAVKGNYSKEYTILFNSFEFTEYMIKYSKQFGVVAMIGIRAKAIMMHLSTTVIHLLANDEKIAKMLKMDDSPEKKKELAFIGDITTSLIHILWNKKGALYYLYGGQ